MQFIFTHGGKVKHTRGAVRYQHCRVKCVNNNLHAAAEGIIIIHGVQQAHTHTPLIYTHSADATAVCWLLQS